MTCRIASKNGSINYINVFEHVLGVSLNGWGNEARVLELEEILKKLRPLLGKYIFEKEETLLEEKDDLSIKEQRDEFLLKTLKEYTETYKSYIVEKFQSLFALFNPPYELSIPSIVISQNPQTAGNTFDFHNTLIIGVRKKEEKILEIQIATNSLHGEAKLNNDFFDSQNVIGIPEDRFQDTLLPTYFGKRACYSTYNLLGHPIRGFQDRIIFVNRCLDYSIEDMAETLRYMVNHMGVNDIYTSFEAKKVLRRLYEKYPQEAEYVFSKVGSSGSVIAKEDLEIEEENLEIMELLSLLE